MMNPGIRAKTVPENKILKIKDSGTESTASGECQPGFNFPNRRFQLPDEAQFAWTNRLIRVTS
jgi:hypothetical protein